MNVEQKLSEQEVADTAKKITAFDLPKEDETLLLASLYMTSSRVKESTQILQDLIDNGSQTTGIHRLIGDIYLCADQLQLAQEFYEKELKLLGDNPPCVERLAVKASLSQIENRQRTEAETEQFNQDIEMEFNALPSDRQESAIAAAIRNLSNKDTQLASLLTALNKNCPIKGCSYRGEITRNHILSVCLICI